MDINLSYFFDLEIGSKRANAIQVLKNCDAFTRNGINVTLYAPFARGVTPESIIFANGMSGRIRFRKIWFSKYFKFILNTLIMVVYSFHDKSDIIYTRNLYYAYLMSFTTRTIVFEAHQLVFDQFYHTLFQKVILKHLPERKRFFIVAISDLLRVRLQRLGVRLPILVCHDGYDPIMIKDGHVSIVIDRGRYDAVAMYTGTMKRFKGLQHIEYLACSNPNVKFILIGDTKNNCDKDLIINMKRLNNVQFIEYIDHAFIPSCLKQADILLLLPTREGVYNDITSPLKLFEYMACGKAILATRMPSIQEVLHEGVNAQLAVDSDIEIDKHFKALVRDKALRERLGMQAKNDVQDYTWEKRVSKIIEYIYEGTN